LDHTNQQLGLCNPTQFLDPAHDPNPLAPAGKPLAKWSPQRAASDEGQPLDLMACAF
jgi:hypothetical protein